MKKSVLMKKSVFILAALPLFLIGCKTPPKIDLVDYSPIAIVSVYSNSSLPWYSKEGEKNPEDSLVTSDLNKVIEKNNPEYQTVQSRIDDAAHILEKCLSENGVTLVDMDAVKNTTVYGSGFNKFYQQATTSTAADGYMVLDYNGNARNRSIARESGAGGTLFAEFIFQKQKIQNGLFDENVAAKVTMKVYVADSTGKKLLYRTYRGLSPESIPYDNGNWDRGTLVSYFPGVVESVVNAFVIDYCNLDFGSN